MNQDSGSSLIASDVIGSGPCTPAFGAEPGIQREQEPKQEENS